MGTCNSSSFKFNVSSKFDCFANTASATVCGATVTCGSGRGWRGRTFRVRSSSTGLSSSGGSIFITPKIPPKPQERRFPPNEPHIPTSPSPPSPTMQDSIQIQEVERFKLKRVVKMVSRGPPLPTSFSTAHSVHLSSFLTSFPFPPSRFLFCS